MDKPENGSIKQPVKIPLLLQIEGKPRLTIEEDGRIIHKGVVIGQDKELADMLIGFIPPSAKQQQGTSQ